MVKNCNNCGNKKDCYSWNSGDYTIHTSPPCTGWSEIKEKEKIMKKSDLKTAMKVVLRNGMEYVVLLNTSNGDILKNITNNTHIKFRDLGNDLTAWHKLFDTMKIYDTNAYDQLVYNKYNLIWERKEIQSVKIDEALIAYNSGKIIKSLVSNIKYSNNFIDTNYPYISIANAKEIKGDWIILDVLIK